MNNQIHNGRDVTKTDPLHVETFKDSDTGLLGYRGPGRTGCVLPDHGEEAHLGYAF